MKAIIAVFLFGMVAIVASRGVNVVEQNPETVTGADEFADRIRDGVASLKSRIEEAKNFLSELRAKVVNNNTPAATPVQVVDNSVNGVSVVDNNPAPGNLVDVVDSGFSQPGANLDIVDPGFYISPQPNVRPPRPGASKPGFENVDSGFYQPGNTQAGASKPGFENVDSGFYQPGNSQAPDPGLHYRK
ncbi:uncharacterized protein LOC120633192 isoform X2 [Pararge aegeria]|uniref:uncharacterized protein LOC120633192 isoform X2 n=1 Tax=Pararge aegeria TaxID=116150 RepID=UPI0019D11AFE|nr:uncharacterized protein LOC120633192 isoform X2 [Pararge aegeria]